MGVAEWAELPQDIIQFISKKLTIYSDYLRFRCVCRTWNSYIPKTPLHLPPQFPWLMLSHTTFFDPSTHKFHHLNLPLSSSHNTLICGSSFGWLIILHEISEVRLLNPITHVTLSLPSLYTLPEFVRKPLESNNNKFLYKVILSSSPSLSDDFAAFSILNFSQLAFCKKSCDSWCLLSVNENHVWTDVVSKNGLFYVVSMKGMIAVCDVEGPRVSIIETTNSGNLLKNIYCVMFSGEDMLLVSRSFLEIDVWQTKMFRVLKMNWNMLNWEEIQTLGENMLFVGLRSCVSFTAADFAGCRPNCIYFTNEFFGRDDFGIYSLSDESIELLANYPLNSDGRLRFPVWVTPNPR
ncbi:probable F-box protein At1g44080 [Vicia villosa]|uniref:probable F-box protein At1g44080 n=1 Tax=Vicia villosa TaxID=3911 RepID=UPI00273BDF7C|nr:probable F-box protein At1g44080 [Vicia villosa]